jgi:uncharacterized protein YecE (DUF72 family)
MVSLIQGWDQLIIGARIGSRRTQWGASAPAVRSRCRHLSYCICMQTPNPNTDLLGCAGWSVPRLLADRFPAAGSHIERYAKLFGATEINSSFYRPHRPQTYARWAASVPDSFRFSVKLPKQISHELQLVSIDEPLARFASEVSALGTRLGCILIQLPPGGVFASEHADEAFAKMRKLFDCMLACEARHPSWFGDDATALLQAHAVTRVVADPPKGQPGAHVPTTAERYVRLHGNPRVYYSSYTDAYLDEIAEHLRLHEQTQHRTWVIFDNTASGAAMANALQVRFQCHRL